MHSTVSLLRPSLLPPRHHRYLQLAAASPDGFPPPLLSSFPSKKFRSQPPGPSFRAPVPLHRTATLEAVETAESVSDFVEVGYLSSVHGLHGEICVEPTTDFPELRFSEPGRRWLKQSVNGKEVIQEVELLEGRENPGKRSWVLRLGGFETVDEARQLIGSALLVREDDRPELEEGEFYTRDLVGMKVILKDTSKCVGTVVDVFNSGACDLLRVMLYSATDAIDGTKTPVIEETGVSGPLVWVPFVEAIVPDVDMHKREMWITPPKGLLELNVRSDVRSKKERRQLEWKERKRLQRQLIAAKKKLIDIEQKHVFDGLRYGEKSQRSFLADEIVAVNSNLLQHALKDVGMSSNRLSTTELVGATRAKIKNGSFKISKAKLNTSISVNDLGANLRFHENGCHLLSEGKIGIVLVLNHQLVDSKSSETENPLYTSLTKTLSDGQIFVKMEDRGSVPLVLVCPEQEIQPLKVLFSSNDFFGFDCNKVWFLEEEKLPVVTSSTDENSWNKILMKSPWEMLKSPVGTGGVIQLLSSHNISNTLSEMGVKYIEVCSTTKMFGGWNPLLLGLVDLQGADVGFQISQDLSHVEESFDLIFSVDFVKSLAKQMDKLHFEAILKAYSHVQLVEKEWVDIVPSSPNSYELRCSIYSCINACPLDKVCIMEIVE
ncbi:unnamed protein product [Linum trigynum]|uniref:Uncharacterized protein n=1 Tax=Linum trigynum TaxID=586398 RepID=A0AAV2FT07_9ROSI